MARKNHRVGNLSKKQPSAVEVFPFSKLWNLGKSFSFRNRPAIWTSFSLHLLLFGILSLLPIKSPGPDANRIEIAQLFDRTETPDLEVFQQLTVAPLPQPDLSSSSAAAADIRNLVTNPLIEVSDVPINLARNLSPSIETARLAYADTELTHSASKRPVGSARGLAGEAGAGWRPGAGLHENGFYVYDTAFRRRVEKLHAGLDLVIVLDATGSMRGVFNQLRIHLQNLSTRLLQTLPNSRIAIVSFRDYHDAIPVASSPLTNSPELLNRFVSQIVPAGGGQDAAESVELGIAAALTQYQFRSEAIKIVILVGDAVPRKQFVPAIFEHVKKFRGLTDSHFHTVTLNHQRPIPLFSQIARKGHGESIVLNRQSNVPMELFLLVFGRENRLQGARFLGLR